MTETYLDLDHWDKEVRHHLQMVESGTEQIANAVRALYGVPNWETRAMRKLKHAERTLRDAYLKLAKAKREMEEKPRVS